MFSNLFTVYKAVTPPSYKELSRYEEPYLVNELNELNELTFNNFSNYDLTPPSFNDQELNYEIVSVDDIWSDTPSKTHTRTSSFVNDNLISNIINSGRSLLGGKYRYGGTDPKTGLDCSSFLQHIFKQNNIDIPRDTSGIFKIGKEVSLNNVKPGDIICSRGSGPSGRHVQLVSRVDSANNLIYVIEAKDRKNGIVEGLLTKKSSDIISVRRVFNNKNNNSLAFNKDVKKPHSNKNQFIKSLNEGFKKVLISRGLDPNYSYVLTALDAQESGWGKHLAGDFNYGGIKISDKEAELNPEKVSRVKTTDYIKGKGYVDRYQNFRKFSSIEDYCNYKITLLSNKRYDAFNSVDSSNPYSFVFHILSKGYGSDYGGSESKKYVASVMKNYNTVINTLKK